MRKELTYTFVVFCLMFLLACGESKTDGTGQDAIEETSGNESNSSENIVEAGKAIYIANCKLCHGDDGTLGSSGSANLQKSVLKTQDLNNIITYGKGQMAGYKDLIEASDIEKVVAYIETLRK